MHTPQNGHNWLVMILFKFFSISYSLIYFHDFEKSISEPLKRILLHRNQHNLQQCAYVYTEKRFN